MNQKQKEISVITIAAGVLLAIFAISGLAPTAEAVIVGTYVDAVANPANGTVNTTPPEAFAPGFSGTGQDDLWDELTGYGTMNNTVLNASADNNDYEQTPVITTSVSGLALGDYNVYVLYWDSTGNNWGLRAALNNPNPTTQYDENSGFWTGDTAFGGVGQLRQVLLGQVSGATSFSVSIDNMVAPTGNERTFYDGVAYEAVVAIPEPASLMLLALGGALVWWTRRGGRR